MKDNILKYSLIWLFVILNAQCAFHQDSSFVLPVLAFKMFFLITIFFHSFSGIRKRFKGVTFPPEFKLLTAYMLLVIISCLRALPLDLVAPSTIANNIMFSICVFMFALNTCSSGDKPFKYFFYGIFLFLITNLILLGVGIENPSLDSIITLEDALMLKNFGVEMERVLLPLSAGEGRVAVGAMAGAVLTYMIALPVYKNKYILLLCSLVPLLVMILGDTRASLLSTLLSLSLFYLIRRYNFRSIRFLPFAMPLFPLVLMFLSYLTFQQGLSAELGRGATGDLASGRSIIWSIALSALSDFNPLHLIGYGAYGQAISGVSNDYMNMFIYWLVDHAELISLHNASIQMVFDIGYLGLIFYMYLMYRLLIISIDSKENGDNILTPVLIYILLSGITETTPLAINAEMFVVFVFVSMKLSLSKLRSI